MEGWVLFVAAIALVGLVQLFALYRARSRWESQGDADADGDRNLDPTSTTDRLDGLDLDLAHEHSEDHDSDRQICPQCGESNEIGYTYCRRCIGHLHRAGNRRQT